MAQTQSEPKLLLPFLQPFYDAVAPLSWLIIRVAVGWNLIVHGYPKLLNGSNDAILKAFADLGYNPPALWFWASAGIETFAGISLILGLFTRFFAAAAAIEMLFITITYWGMDSAGCAAVTNMCCCGGCCALPSRCAAAVRIRSIARSAANCKRALLFAAR